MLAGLDHHSLIEPNVVGQILEIAECRPGAVSVDQRSALAGCHAVVKAAGVRAAKAMGPRNLPSKSWQVKASGTISPRYAGLPECSGIKDRPPLLSWRDGSRVLELVPGKERKNL